MTLIQTIRHSAGRGAGAAMLPAGLLLTALLLCAAPVLTAAPAQAAPWKAERTDNGTRYRIGNAIRNSFEIHCGRKAVGKGRTWIVATLFGEPLPRSGTVKVTVGGAIFRLDVDPDGVITTHTQDADKTFELLWSALRENPQMTVSFPDGLAGTFTLRGTAEAMPSRACETDFDRP
ncbi:MAG: hypothetical protein RIB84_04805 [Sneathiellaceae bacterium]